MIGPLLRLAAATAAGRAIKGAATQASNRALLTMTAGVAGAVGIFYFSGAALTLMERNMDPAAAWAVMGRPLRSPGVWLLFRGHSAPVRGGGLAGPRLHHASGGFTIRALTGRSSDSNNSSQRNDGKGVAQEAIGKAKAAIKKAADL